MQYLLDKTDLPKLCNGCNAALSIFHALDCNRGGLVTARHNELRDGVADLYGKYFTPIHVLNDPLISTGCTMKRETENMATSKTTPSTKKLEEQKRRASY